MRGSGLVCVAVAITACGGGGDGGNGGNGGTNPPPQVASVVITSPPTAQTISACGSVSLAAEARNAQGGVVTATIGWRSSDQSKVALSSTSGASNTGRGVGIGSSTITATANNGTVSSTGVTVTVQGGGASSDADVEATASNTFSPNCVTINAGGRVSWTFVPSPSHNVRFQGAGPTGGDIPTTQNTTVSRTFPTAGTYSYLCDLHAGMNGIVVVQ